MSKLWGGRFSKNTDACMDDFHSSIAFDQRLYHQDIAGSIAHATMLGASGIISKEEADTIAVELQKIEKDIADGAVVFSAADEDIHMNIERLLIERIGEAGKKLHTGRSRNDQVAVDLKMYVRSEVVATRALLISFIEALHQQACTHQSTAMPGYTHLQRAQPITFGHHLLAYVEMFKRDVQRLDHWLSMHQSSPLGSGALAGTTYPLDCYKTAQALGFAQPYDNSLDGVSDRDYVMDYHYAASVSMIHLSRLCEEIILWSTQEFNFIDLDDAYSTGSSIMPQKKNPDVAELTRGKSGRVVGNLMALLMTMKGLPLAYNKDMQEDKEGLFDSVNTWKGCLTIMTSLISTMRVNKDQMYHAACDGFINATDLADYLVTKGLPFREAHRIVGTLVMTCLNASSSLSSLSLDEFQQVCPAIQSDVYQAIDIQACIDRRNTHGGPGKDALNEALMRVSQWLSCQQSV